MRPSGVGLSAHSAVPVVDHWNMFAAGKPWVAYSWSNELIIGLADRAFGIKGLLVLQAIIAVLLSISLAVGFSLLSRDWFFGLLLGAFTTLSCISHFSLRPQTLTWIYYVAALVLADRIFVGWFSVEVRARDADCVFLCGRMRTLRRHLVFFAVAAWSIQ